MYLNTKEDIDLNDLKKMDAACFYLLSQCILYSKVYGFDVVLTSLISDRKAIRSQSKTHEEGRAFDIGVKTIPELHRPRLVKKLNEMFCDIGAIGNTTNKSVVAIDEGDHIHIQVRPHAPIANLITWL